MTQMKKKRVDLGLNKNALEPLKTRVPEAKEFRKYFCSLKGNKWNMKRVLRSVSHIHTAVFKMDNPQGLLRWLSAKESPCRCRRQETRFSPGWGRSSGGGNGSTVQSYCLENPTDRGAWRATGYGVAESDVTEHKHHTARIYEEGVFSGDLKRSVFSGRELPTCANSTRSSPVISWGHF